VNLDIPVVADEAQLAKLVHEVADSGSRGAYHFRQCFLTDVGTDRLCAALIAKIREQQEQPCKSPFARIEELVDEVLLNQSAGPQTWGTAAPVVSTTGSLIHGRRAKRTRAAGMSLAARALRSDVVRRAASRGGTLRCAEARRVAYRDVDKSYASHRRPQHGAVARRLQDSAVAV
jgi:hypothetical protein